MSDTPAQDASAAKLLKQLTAGKRRPAKKGAAGKEETKSDAGSAKSMGSLKQSVQKAYRSNAPAFLQRASAKTAFDVALFATSVFLIIKYGKEAHELINGMIPTEAMMRDMMEKSMQEMGPQGGPMGPM